MSKRIKKIVKYGDHMTRPGTISHTYKKKNQQEISASLIVCLSERNWLYTCLVISSHLSLKTVSRLWTWFPENQVETDKS